MIIVSFVKVVRMFVGLMCLRLNECILGVLMI